MWYNHEPLINLETIHERRKDYTNDCVSRLLGNARIRQLRVVEGKCSGVSLMQQLREDCSPKLDGSTEDTDTYNIRWATGGYTDTRRLSSAWRYTQKSNSNSSHYYGKTSTLYHAGGYIGDMGSTRKSTQLVLSNLVKDVWLDHMTRAVFVELTLYNANTRFFNQVILIIEQVQTGQYLPYVNVESVRSDVNLNFWYSFFILFILLLFLRMCLQINRKGLLLYLSTFLLMFELVLLIIGILIVIVYIIHTVASSIYIQQFKTSGLDSFFSFFKIQYYSNLCRSLLSVLYALMIVRLLMSFHFGKNYVDFYYTFLLSLSWIVNISFLFILYFVITWRFLGYLTSNFIFPYYSRIISPPNSFRNYRYNEPIGYYVILYILCFISNFLMALLTAAFVYYYCVAKAYKLLDSDPFSYIEFLKDKLKKRRNND